jgi:REP element-mobilizing transposase RayT
MSDHVGPRASRPHRGWHERGYLPHFDGGAIVQMITFWLADSLPRAIAEQILSSSKNEVDRILWLEKYIDQGRGACLLADVRAASLVRDAVMFFDGERYRLLKWVIMPNHIHVLIEQLPGFPLDRIVHSWKSYTAKAINKLNGTSGAVWAADYFDRYIRNEDHYRNASHYIENNPVKAKLAAKAEAWAFSSAAVQVEESCGQDARGPT